MSKVDILFVPDKVQEMVGRACFDQKCEPVLVTKRTTVEDDYLNLYLVVGRQYEPKNVEKSYNLWTYDAETMDFYEDFKDKSSLEVFEELNRRLYSFKN